MNAFAVRLVHGPAWDDTRAIREQQGWPEHAAFMDTLVADGFVLHGGPIGAGNQTLHLVEAEDEDALRRRWAEDPWARDGLLVVGSVERWQLWLDHRGT